MTKVSIKGSHMTQTKLPFLPFVLEVLILSSFDTYSSLNTNFMAYEQLI